MDDIHNKIQRLTCANSSGCAEWFSCTHCEAFARRTDIPPPLPERRKSMTRKASEQAEEIERLRAREQELLACNTELVERRRDAERKYDDLRAALRNALRELEMRA